MDRPRNKTKGPRAAGHLGNLTIDQARDAARVRLGAVAEGSTRARNGSGKRRRRNGSAPETARTLEVLVSDWATLHLEQRRPRYASEAQRAIRFAFAELLKRPAARITKADGTLRWRRPVGPARLPWQGEHWPMPERPLPGHRSVERSRAIRSRVSRWPPARNRNETGRCRTKSLLRCGRRHQWLTRSVHCFAC